MDSLGCAESAGLCGRSGGGSPLRCVYNGLWLLVPRSVCGVEDAGEAFTGVARFLSSAWGSWSPGTASFGVSSRAGSRVREPINTEPGEPSLSEDATSGLPAGSTPRFRCPGSTAAALSWAAGEGEGGEGEGVAECGGEGGESGGRRGLVVAGGDDCGCGCGGGATVLGGTAEIGRAPRVTLKGSPPPLDRAGSVLEGRGFAEPPVDSRTGVDWGRGLPCTPGEVLIQDGQVFIIITILYFVSGCTDKPVKKNTNNNNYI